MGRALAAATGACAIALLALPAGASATEIFVDTTGDTVADDGGCVLREAIISANDNLAPGTVVGECEDGDPGADTISFDFFPKDVVQTIQITATGELPEITEPLTIDGDTQCSDGTCDTEGPLVEIDGNDADEGGVSDALSFQAGSQGSVVSKLIINEAADAGIGIVGANQVTVDGNWIGIEPDGTTAAPNAAQGIYVATEQNVIGGDGTPVVGNVISGNGDEGIQVDDTATMNVIQGNSIGATPDGSSALGNEHGILIEGDNTEVGGNQANEGNLISGHDNMANDAVGILVDGGGIPVAENTNILGNLIGTDTGGTLDLGNDIGIRLEDDSDQTTIGGSTAAERNVISGNGGGISGRAIDALDGANDVVIQGNYIGTTADGTGGLGNGQGVNLQGVTGTSELGGAAPGEGNVISDHGNSGSRVSGGSGTLSIRGNRIGTSADGMTALGNGNQGIRVEGRSNFTIGGAAPGAGNLIAASGNEGILLQSSDGVAVQNNLIGTSADGLGAAASFGNGQTPANQNHGIRIEGQDNVIGGATPFAQNTIANSQNGGDGVFVVADTSDDGNLIVGNSIFDNDGLGIDLQGGVGETAEGVTPNDGGAPPDSDTGPNNLQNFPVITSASRTTDQINAAGTLNSTPATQFTVDVYANMTCDPSDFGEGQFYVGSALVTTNGSGEAVFNLSLQANSPPNANQITVTATRAGANPPTETSEFSACFPAAAIPAPAPSPPAPSTPLAPVVLPGTALLALDTVKLKKNKIPVEITCQAGGSPCNGTIELKTAGKVLLATIAAKKKKRKKKVVPLGSASFSIPAGQSQVVPVKVPKKGRKLFKKRAKVRATATITTTGGAGRTVTDSLRVKKPKKKNKKKK